METNYKKVYCIYDAAFVNNQTEKSFSDKYSDRKVKGIYQMLFERLMVCLRNSLFSMILMKNSAAEFLLSFMLLGVSFSGVATAPEEFTSDESIGALQIV